MSGVARSRSKAAEGRSPGDRDAQPAKPKITKSRNGCVTCKAKRLKCDETKPTCLQCKKRNVECGGYKKDFKWKAFDEESFQPGSSRKSPKATGTSDSPPSRRGSTPVAVPPQPGPSDFSLHAADFSQSLAPPSSDRGSLSPVAHHPSLPPQYEPSSRRHSGASFPVAGGSLNQSFYHDRGLSPNPYASYTQGPEDFVSTAFIPVQMPTSSVSMSSTGQLQALDTSLNPSLSHHAFMVQQSLQDLPGHEVAASQYQPATELPMSHIRTQLQPIQGQLVQEPSMYQDQGTQYQGWGNVGEPSLQQASHTNPQRAYAGQRMQHGFTENDIYDEFSNESYSILSMNEEQTGDPWPNALATAVILALAESGDESPSTTVQYLNMGRPLVEQGIDEIGGNRLDGESIEQFTYILQIWLFMDVMATLPTKEHGFASQLAGDICNLASELGDRPESDHRLTSRATLLRMLGSVAELVQRVRSSNDNDEQLVSAGEALRQSLLAWECPDSRPSKPYSKLMGQISETFRWSGLLLVHQAVPEIPSESSSEIASTIRGILKQIPAEVRSSTSHCFPLLVAGCEATRRADRSWVQSRWESIGDRLQVGSVEKCLATTKEVWRRRDRANRPGASRSLDRATDTLKRKRAAADQWSSKRTRTLSPEETRAPQSTGLGVDSTNKRRPKNQVVGVQSPVSYQLTTGGGHASACGVADAGDPQGQPSTWDSESNLQTDARQHSAPALPEQISSYVSPATARFWEEMPFGGTPPTPPNQGNSTARLLGRSLISPRGHRDSRQENSPAPAASSAQIARQIPRAAQLLSFNQTVRGQHHWLGVAEEYGWELLLI